MSVSAIAASTQAASLYPGSATVVISRVTTTSVDGSLITVTTTYANGTTSTVTYPSPRSGLLIKEINTTNPDHTITTTKFYADGTTSTTTQANPNPTDGPNALAPGMPSRPRMLLWA